MKNFTPESMIKIWKCYRNRSRIALLAKELGISTACLSRRATTFEINNKDKASDTNHRFEMLEYFRHSYHQGDFLEEYLTGTEQTYEQWDNIRRWFNRRGLRLGTLRRKDRNTPRFEQFVPKERKKKQVTKATPVKAEPIRFEIFVY